MLENATELLRARKQSAWREVARRVAHEIKNPLTPISLSAEQIHRHIDRLAHARTRSRVALHRRHPPLQRGHQLGGRFHALAGRPVLLARPVSHRRAASRRLNTIVENSLALFAGRLQTSASSSTSRPISRSSWPTRKPSSAPSATSSTTPPRPCRQPAPRLRITTACSQRYGRAHRL